MTGQGTAAAETAEQSADQVGSSSGQSADGRERLLLARWLGRVDYHEAWDLQQQLFDGSADHLLFLEHDPVYTIGRSGQPENLLVDPESIGAEFVRVNRGGDVTFHGPGQVVGYPIIDVPGKRGGGMADTLAYVTAVEQTVIDVLAELGLAGSRLSGFPGVWLDVESARPRKIAAIGVRLSRGRSMHGFALNVDVDLDWFSKMVPCGIADKDVTSLRAEGSDASMEQVVDLLVASAARNLVPDAAVDRSDVVWRHAITDLAPFSRGLGPGEAIKPRADRPPAADPPAKAAPTPSTGVPVRLKGRLAQAGVEGGLHINERKPSWMRVSLRTDEAFRDLRATARSLDLTTVCEAAGCPNIFECWNEGTATFMLLGERCTRACGFCLIDTQKPDGVDWGEPERVAEAVEKLGLNFAVLTMVARDDLPDGGAALVAATVEAIKDRNPGVGVEVLISDLQGSATDLETVCASQPDIVNHNVETVARLQRAVRPSAGYARSLALLSRAKQHGMTTKSGLIVGMGETFDEVVSTLADLAAIGVDVVTIGQYLRPTSHHLPIHRWWEPAEFDELKRIGESEFGLAHVASSPLTRSSHHAGTIAQSVGGANQS
ncbi:MAG: lipoyl synthase [Acidimicrobiales bacterium]